MSDYGSVVVPTHIHTGTEYGVGANTRASGAAAMGFYFSWVANEASYQPLWLPFPYLVQRMFWCNGSTLTSTNVDVGIYSTGGARLWSAGATAASGTNAVQYVALATPLLLTPGCYYLAYACSNTTNRTWGLYSALVGSGLLSQSNALPLPAIATFAAYSGLSIPMLGITNTASGF